MIQPQDPIERLGLVMSRLEARISQLESIEVALRREVLLKSLLANTGDLAIGGPATLPAGLAGQYLGLSSTLNPEWQNLSRYLSRRMYLFHHTAIVLTGAAMGAAIDNLLVFNTVWFQNPAANGDSFTQSIVMRAGLYNFSVVGNTSTDRGKIDWYYKHSSESAYTAFITGQDWYSAALTRNQIKIGALTLPLDGYYTIKGVVNGKNAASSAFIMSLISYWIAPSAD